MSNYGVISKGEYLHKQSNEFLHVDRFLILRRKSKRYLLLDFENLHDEALTGMTLQIDQLDARGHSLGFVNVDFNGLNFPKGKFILKEKIKVHSACLDFKVKILRAEYGECVYHLGDNHTFATLEKKKVNKPINRKTVEKEVGEEGYVAEARRFKTPVFIGVFALILAIVCFAGIFLHLASFGKNEGTFFVSNIEYKFVSDDKLEEDGVYVIGSVGLGGQDIVVPSTVEGYPVKWIETGAFSDNKKIKTLTVNGDVVIKEGAFTNCKNLETVLLNGVSSVEANAFANCRSLESFTANRLSSIGDKTFENCEKLSTVLIKDLNAKNVLTISGSPFIGCGDVNSITIDQFINYTDKNEFFVGVTSVEELHLKNFDYSEYDVDKTPERALVELFTDIESAELPEEGGDSGTENGDDNGATVTPMRVSPREQISEDIRIVKVIIDYMDYVPKEFAKDLKTSLTSFTVNHISEETVGEKAFLDCAFLSEVNFPVKLTAIGNEAFKSTAITAFDISNASLLGESAFENCASLAEVSTSSTTPLTIISASAFKDCVALSSFSVPSAVTDIEKEAFKASGLTKIEFCENCAITTINESTFENCASLAGITLPSEVLSIDTSAFAGCSTLSKIVFPENFKSIGVGSFANCVSLGSIDLPSKLEIIGALAFMGCSAFETFTVPDSVTAVGAGMLNGCTLESVTLPFIGSSATNSSYKNLGYLFATFNMDGQNVTYQTDNTLVPETLKTVTLTTGIEVPENAFKDCVHVTTFNLPSTVKKIHSGAFENCESIRTIILPSALVEILGTAFKGCVNMRTITLTSNLTTINNDAFTDCFRLFEIIDVSPMNNVNALPIAEYALAVYEGENAERMQKVEVGGFTLAKTLDTQKWYVIDHTASGDIVLPSITESDTYYLPSKYFYNDENITSVVVSNQIVELGDMQFAYCDKLLSVVFEGGSLGIDIGAKTFYACSALETLNVLGRELIGSSFTTETIFGCTSLKNVSLPVGMQEIFSAFFKNNTKLESIELSSSITTVKSEAFSGCTALKTVTLYGATIVEDDAFNGCTALTTITMPVIETLGARAFSGCIALTEIKLNEVSIINENTFNNCQSLTYVEGCNVTEIGKNAFKDCKLLRSVDASVITLSENAFSGCESLETINLSNATTIETSAFSGCKSLSNITSLSAVQSIGEYAFYNCQKLGNINLPSSLTSIGNYAFAYVGSSEIDLSNTSFTSIPSHLFYGSSVETVYLPNTIETISDNVFDGCSKLSYLNWTSLSNLNEIGDRAFYGCAFTLLTIPSSVTDIGSYAFYGCNSLTTVRLVNTENLGNGAFSNCTALQTVDLGSSLQVIPDSAFMGCTALGNITIPSNVTYISNGAFYGCSNLSSVTFTSSTNKLTIQNAEGESEHVFGGTKLYSLNTNGRVSEIGDYAFYGITTLTSIDLDGCGSIGNNAFYGCTGLVSADLSGATTIKSNSFNGCSKLSDVTFGSNVIVYSRAFANCTSLENIDLSDASTINSNVFIGCTNLTEATLSGTVYSAFTGCTALETLDFENATIIGDAFKNMTSLKAVVFNGSSSIGESAFKGCTNLNNLILTGVSSIGSYAFQNCTALEELILSSSGSVGYYAFSGCTGLEFVALPSGLTSNKIDSTAFTACYNLHEILELTSSSVTIGSSDTFGNVAYYALKVYTSSNYTRLAEGTTSEGFVCKYNNSECWIVGYDGNATTLTVGNSITVGNKTFTAYSIAKYAFRDDYNISTLYVNSGVKSVGEYAFPSVRKLILAKDATVTYYSFGYNNKTVYYRGTSDCTSINNSTVYYYTDCVHEDYKWTEENGQIIDYVQNYVKVTKPTCTERGYSQEHCSVCHTALSDKYDYVAASHNYVDNLCTVCGDISSFSVYSTTDLDNIFTLTIDGFVWYNSSQIRSNITANGNTATVTITAKVDFNISIYIYVYNKGTDDVVTVKNGDSSQQEITSSGTKTYNVDEGESLVITYTIDEDSTASSPYVSLSSISISNPTAN